MERCSACRSRLGDMPICPRCGCDFTLAIRAELQAQHLVIQAIQAWYSGDQDLAENYVGKSLALKQSGLAEVLKGMLCEYKKQTRVLQSSVLSPPCRGPVNPSPIDDFFDQWIS